MSMQLDDALFKAVKNKSFPDIKRALENGANANARSPEISANHKTVLMEAVISIRNPKILMLLFHYGADVHAIDDRGNTSLHYATCFTDSSIDQIRFLLENDADPNCENNIGITPFLNVCKQSGLKPIIELLIKHGADYKGRHKSGKLYIDYIENDDVFNELLSKFDEQTIMLESNNRREGKLRNDVLSAVEKGFYKKAEALINTMNEPVFEVDDMSPIVLAAKTPSRNQLKSLEMLMNKGYDINQTSEAETTTPLAEAVKRQDFKLFQWLIEKGANPHQILRAGQTPLKMAEQIELFEMVNFVQSLEDQQKLDKLIVDQDAEDGLNF